MSKLVFTEEQESVLQTVAEPGKLMFVKAIAGAGKTATLIEYVRRYQDTNFLYLAYNRSAIEEVRGRIALLGIPNNVTCKTIDSLATGSSTIKFKGPIQWSSYWNNYYLNYLVKEKRKYPSVIQKLLESFDDPFKSNELSVRLWSLMQDFVLSNSPTPSTTTDEELNLHMQYMWKSVLEGKLKSPDFGWTVKAVAESEQRLSDMGIEDVQVIIVDESQDINWPMFKIIANQVYCRKKPLSAIMVGDPNQHLYSFRQCISVFDDIKFPKEHTPKTHILSKSCRFGPAIADYANFILNSIRSEIWVDTIHNDRKDSVQKSGFIFPRDIKNLLKSLPSGERLGVLFMSNKSMLECYNNCGIDNVEILGNSCSNSSLLQQLWDEYNLDPKRFSEEFQAKDRFKVDPDASDSKRDEAFFSDFIINNSKSVPELISKLQTANSQKTEGAATNCEVVFSTIHQAKGREFHTVVLSPIILEKKNQLDRKLKYPSSKNEKQYTDFHYLFYTAATRAKHTLILPH